MMVAATTLTVLLFLKGFFGCSMFFSWPRSAFSVIGVDSNQSVSWTEVDIGDVTRKEVVSEVGFF